MFNTVPDMMSTGKRDLEKGSYAIVDWVANNPMSVNQRYPVLLGMNISKEKMDDIKEGRYQVPAGPGTIQRAYLKIEDVIYYTKKEEEEEK